MTAEQYTKFAKIALIIPMLTGLLTLMEYLLPLQQVTSIVHSKRISNNNKLGNTTYSIDFENNNDQFTEVIYNTVNEGETVKLQVLRFSKEVKTLQKANSTIIFENKTSEVYFQLGIAIAFIAFSSYYLRRKYLTNKNYRYISILSIIALVSLIRIITLNS